MVLISDKYDSGNGDGVPIPKNMWTSFMNSPYRECFYRTERDCNPDTDGGGTRWGGRGQSISFLASALFSSNWPF